MTFVSGENHDVTPAERRETNSTLRKHGICYIYKTENNRNYEPLKNISGDLIDYAIAKLRLSHKCETQIPKVAKLRC